MADTDQLLISASDLAASIADPDPDALLVVVDCRFNLLQPGEGREKYDQGHIPGAFYAHLDDDLASPIGPRTGRHPLPERDVFRRLVGSWGVEPATRVVVYDQGPGAIAARLWWLLRWIGHSRVSLLDGGYRAWKEAGHPVSTDPAAPDAGAGLAGSADEQTPWITTTALMQTLPEACLVDARSGARFRGESEPIDSVAGHIPGAVSRPFEDNLGEDGLFLDAAALRDAFLAVPGLSEAAASGKPVIHSCGSGVTACHNMLAMELSGLGDSVLYVGSWSEWIRDPDRAVATGED